MKKNLLLLIEMVKHTIGKMARFARNFIRRLRIKVRRFVRRNITIKKMTDHIVIFCIIFYYENYIEGFYKGILFVLTVPTTALLGK